MFTQTLRVMLSKAKHLVLRLCNRHCEILAFPFCQRPKGSVATLCQDDNIAVFPMS